jgi:hypothetical protein
MLKLLIRELWASLVRPFQTAPTNVVAVTLIAFCALSQGTLASDSSSTKKEPNGPGGTPKLERAPSSDKGSNIWLMAYFRQRYEGRVEIDSEGRASQVPLPNPMRDEHLHFALSSDGRHWQPLNGNKPAWDQWLRDPFIQRDPDGTWHLLATGGIRDRRHPPEAWRYLLSVS